MSNVVEQILARSRLTIVVNDAPYVVRKITSTIAVNVLGSKALAIVRASMSEKGEDATPGQRIALIRQYLAECMVSPKSGAESDPGADVIAFSDMGGDEVELFSKLLEASGWVEQVADFQRPSEGEKE